jgi:hypothetical protein
MRQYHAMRGIGVDPQRRIGEQTEGNFVAQLRRHSGAHRFCFPQFSASVEKR